MSTNLGMTSKPSSEATGGGRDVDIVVALISPIIFKASLLAW